MEKYPKLFVGSSVVYFSVAVMLGMLIATPLFSDAYMPSRFTHVHLNMIGFMSMMVIGVAYHILPRFNGTPLPYPGLVPAQFYMMHAGLWLLVLGQWLADSPAAVFHTGATLVIVAVIIFAVNIIGVLRGPRAVESPIADTAVRASDQPAGVPAKTSAPTAPAIASGMKLGKTLDAYPYLEKVFAEKGFKGLADPSARKSYAGMLTIEQAIARSSAPAGFNLESFIGELNAEVARQGGTAAAGGPRPAEKPAESKKVAETINPGGKGIAFGEKCTPEVMVGELMKTYPATRGVIEKFYGAACFTCPGQAFETIAQTASMHNTDLTVLLKALNAEIETSINQPAQ